MPKAIEMSFGNIPTFARFSFQTSRAGRPKLFQRFSFSAFPFF